MADFLNAPYRFKSKSNNHKNNKVRDLTDKDKKFIKKEFIKLNGQFPYKYCSKIKEKLGPDISVFQVSGYVTHKLHAQAKSGKINLKDFESYKKFLDDHRKKWKTYKSEKYNPLLKYDYFFQLYQDYKQDFDKFIWKVARSFQGQFDPCEMYSQIIFKLLNSNVINDYNKKLNCKFKSYIIQRIHGYASHIIAEHCKEMGRKDIRLESGFKEESIKPYNPYNSPSDPYTKITYKEMEIYAKKNLDEKEFKVFTMRINGHSNNDIAETVDVTLPGVDFILQRIRKKLKMFRED